MKSQSSVFGRARGGSAVNEIQRAPEEASPQLLRQMEMLMGTPWEHAADEQQMVAKIEACRSVLALFTSGSGVYQELLSKIFYFLFSRIDGLADKTAALQQSNVVHPQPASNGLDSNVIPADQATARTQYAFARAKKAEDEIRALLDAANAERAQYKDQVQRMRQEQTHLKELLVYRDNREKRKKFDSEEVFESRAKEMVTTLDLERQIFNLTSALADSNRQVEINSNRCQQLLELNGKYARQTVELSARIKVLSEHNEKFATLLALQYDEKQSVERDNELLRNEVLELSRMHKLHANLEGEVTCIHHNAQLRSIRYGLGSNANIPRHLQFSGLMNRNVLERDTALSIVSEFLVNRSAQLGRTEFQNAFHNFLTKRYGADAVMWAYNIDDACRLYDFDPHLSLFYLVTHRVISEQVYSDLGLDVSIFLEACEIIDRVQHTEPQGTVPVLHILGLLLEMFPWYPDSAFRRIMIKLQSTLTTDGYAHYPMLFPNRERDFVPNSEGGAGSLSRFEVRNENDFSAMFRELVVDDVVVTTQLVEDMIWHSSGDKIGMHDVQSIVGQVFGDAECSYLKHSVALALRDPLIALAKEHAKDGGVSASVEIHSMLTKPVVINTIRTKCALRRGTAMTPSRVQQRQQLFAQALNEWTSITGEEPLQLDFAAILQGTKSKRPEPIRDSDTFGVLGTSDGSD